MVLSRLLAEGWRRADTALAVALIAFASLVIVEANRLPPPFFDPLGSAAVPRMVAGILIVLALILLARCLLTTLPVEPAGQSGSAVKASPWVALCAAIVPILYVGAMQFEFLGFAPASALFVLFLGAVLARWRLPALLVLLPIAVVAGYGLNAVLTEFFFIDLPQNSFWTEAV